MIAELSDTHERGTALSQTFAPFAPFVVPHPHTPSADRASSYGGRAMSVSESIPVAVLGATGYAGEFATRILLEHPRFLLVHLGSDRLAGTRYADAVPAFAGDTELKLEPDDADALERSGAKAIVLAKKSPEITALVPELLAHGIRLVDIGAEFRLREIERYRRHYGDGHDCPELLEEAVYGLSETHRDAIADARVVGNPGCYATSILLPLLPLLRAGLIDHDSPMVSTSYSGASGAGKRHLQSNNNLFYAVNENLHCYQALTHKHHGEIDQELSAAAGTDVHLRFVPHLAPITRPDLINRDPENVWLARQGRFRVEAEVIRDLSLAVSGLLNPTIGGPSIRPPLPEGLANLGYANQVKWNVSDGAEKYRRGLYIFFQRTVPYPTLMTFDCPDSNVTTGKRNRSNTPLQALTLLNNTVYAECAQHFGKRILEEGGDSTDDRIRTAYLLALGREPTRNEKDIVKKLVADYREAYEAEPERGETLLTGSSVDAEDCTETAVWVSTGRVLLNLDEFMTRE